VENMHYFQHVHLRYSSRWHSLLVAQPLQAREYFTRKRQEEHEQRLERERKQRLELRRQRGRFASGSVFAESDTDDSGAEFGDGSQPRSRSASVSTSEFDTTDDESESDDSSSDDELPPDPFWDQRKGTIWRTLESFEDPYVVMALEVSPAPSIDGVDVRRDGGACVAAMAPLRTRT